MLGNRCLSTLRVHISKLTSDDYKRKTRILKMEQEIHLKHNQFEKQSENFLKKFFLCQKIVSFVQKKQRNFPFFRIFQFVFR